MTQNTFGNFALGSIEDRTAKKLLRKVETETWKKSYEERRQEVIDHMEAGMCATMATSVRITMKVNNRDLLVECLQTAHPYGLVEDLFQATDMLTDELVCDPCYLCDFVEWLITYTVKYQ